MAVNRPTSTLVFVAAFISSVSYGQEMGNADEGRIVFEQICGICHAVSQDGSGPPMGPNLWGLIGRKIGSEPNFAMYSAALSSVDAEWTPEFLNEFLLNPAAKVPGTTMPVMVSNEKDRANIVAYISSLK